MGRAIVTERDVSAWRAQQLQETRQRFLEKAMYWQDFYRPLPQPQQEPSPPSTEEQPEETKQPPQDDEQREEWLLHQIEEALEEAQRRPAEEVIPPPPPLPPPLPSSVPPTLDTYTDRLLKLIPAESVALYLTLQGIILSGAGDTPNLNIWLWFILVVGLIGTALYQWRILKIGIGKLVQLATSTAAFGVWVFALGGAFASLPWYEPFIGSLSLVIFTFFAPLISPDVLTTDQE